VYHRITEEIAEGRSLGIWLGSVSPSARAAIAASASAWATRACLTVPWRSVERVIFTPQSTWYRPVPRSNAIVLVGRPDAVVLVRGSRAQERVLLRIGSHDCVAVELDLLVASLDRGRAPLRYVTVTPATGEIKADRVDKRALRSAVDRIQHALPVLTGQSNDATPGSQCRWCELRSGCQPGKVWMEKNSLMGRLPVAAIEAEIPSDRNGAD
jgi:hypothetical protein